MSNEFLETPLLEASAKDDNENYSEWRLLRDGCLFNGIEVNTGFQGRDFQTNHGTLVVDPEIYCKLQKEANSICWSLSFRPFSVLLIFLLICASIIFLPVLLALGLVAYMILLYLLVFPVFLVLYEINTRADNQTHVLVDSYKEHFLKEYGVELGYSRFTSDDGVGNVGILPGIYLRRPHRSREEKDFGDTIPPIFIDRTMPGDVDLFRTANLDLTVADAKACSFLRSIYLEEVKIQPTPGAFCILALLIFMPMLIVLSAAWESVFMVMASSFFTLVLMVVLVVLIVMDDKDFGNRKAVRALSQCQEVAQCVTEALQSDKDIAGTLSVEFSTSPLPGRDTQQCRRFQFVRHSTAPSTRNEMTDVSGCV